MKAKLIATFFLISNAAFAEPDDLVLEIFSWDTQKAKTLSGWFADSAKIKKIEKAVADSAPTRKAIEVAQAYLTKNFSELTDSLLGDDPFALLGETAATKEKVKSWTFVRMSVRPIDLGRGRGTLISWTPKESGLFYYALEFTPQFEGRSAYQKKTVVLLPNLEVVPFRTIPATEEERGQIVWWERHLSNHEHLDKEDLIQSQTR